MGERLLVHRPCAITSRFAEPRRGSAAGDYKNVIKPARLRYVDCIRERVKRTLAAIGLIGATIAVYLLVSRPGRQSLPKDTYPEECAVSECGPDGMPLSLYAG